MDVLPETTQNITALSYRGVSGGGSQLGPPMLFLFHVQTVFFCHRLEKQQRSDIQLSKRLASLGIMEGLIEDPQKPLGVSQHYRIVGFKGVGSQFRPHDAERR